MAEHGRYHLDLRHPATVKHLDEVTDFLVGDLGVGYLKLDYNINPGPGTDTGGAQRGGRPARATTAPCCAGWTGCWTGIRRSP